MFAATKLSFAETPGYSWYCLFSILPFCALVPFQFLRAGWQRGYLSPIKAFCAALNADSQSC